MFSAVFALRYLEEQDSDLDTPIWEDVIDHMGELVCTGRYEFCWWRALLRKI